MADKTVQGAVNYSYTQLYDLLKGRGATGYQADQLAAIALAESGGYSGAHSPAPERSFGFFQINLDWHPTMNEVSAADPVASATYALKMFKDQGPKPWSVSHDEWRGTRQDYRQYLKGELPVIGSEDPAWAGSLKYSEGESIGPAVITPPDVYGTGGAPTGSELTITGAGADRFALEWPDRNDYGDISEYNLAVFTIAEVYGYAGIQMPAGAPDIAKAAWHAARQDAVDANDPTAQALNMARAAQIAEELRTGKILFPFDLERIKQDIRLAEPFGSEKVLRSSEGQLGFNDYWAGKSPSNKEGDYMAGFNLARAGDEPRQDAVASYLDRVSDEIGQQIEIRGQNINAAGEELRSRINLFDSAQRSFTNIQQFTIPGGREFIPGFEPGGFAASIGLQPLETSTIKFDPFQMALDLISNTPRPTGFDEPSLPGVYDKDIFDAALDFYGEQI